MGSDVAAVVRGSATSFYYSFSFLPKIQREALRTVYAFCRQTDDLVDEPSDVQSRMARLHRWKAELGKSLEGTSAYTLLNELADVARRFHIPVIHFYELIEGVEMDLQKNRYATFEELRTYCYHVASSVGLMCLGIFSAKFEKTKEYAINLGIALQLTNIIRDVGIDAKYGRIYIPLEDLRRFHCSEGDILTRRYSPEFVGLMEFEVRRAEEFFQKAQASLPTEERRAMFAAKIMERIYFHTLQRIKEAKYNVFATSVSLPRSLKFMIALKYWLTHRVFAA